MYSVNIKNNSTSEVRKVDFNLPWNNDSSHFLWTQGNYSCDCNKHLFFSNSEEDFKCGDDVYSIVDITLDDGSLIKIDK